MVLKQLTLFVLSFILVNSLAAAILGTSVQVLLYPDIYQDTLEKNQAYDFIETQLADSGYLPDTIFVQDGIKPLTNRLLKNFLAYVRGDSENLDLKLDVKGTLEEFFLERINELPVCKNNIDVLASNDITCKPADIEPNEFLDLVLEAQGASDIPTEIDLATVFDKEDKLPLLKENVLKFKESIYIAWLITFASIILILLISRSLSVSTDIIDTDFFLVALTMFVTSYGARENFHKIPIPQNLLGMENIIFDLIVKILDTMTYYASILIGIAIGLAIFTIIWNFIRGKKTTVIKIPLNKNKNTGTAKVENNKTKAKDVKTISVNEIPKDKIKSESKEKVEKVVKSEPKKK